MGIPANVTHDPIADALNGVGAQSLQEPDVNGLAASTFGFLYSKGDWGTCYAMPTNTFSACFLTPGNTFTDCYAGVSTGWTLCYTES